MEKLINVEKSNKNYCFKLTSSLTKINLPYSVKSSSHLKILFLKYTILTASQELLLIKISHFNKHVYFDGNNIVKYCKAIALPPGVGTPLIYESNTNAFDVFVDERDGDDSGLNNITIEILIDGLFSSDISPSNPLYIELQIY